MNIEQWARRGAWRRLEALAYEMVRYAERHAGGAQMEPLLGGGTRLMLALHHRISEDIDLFIRDAQWLGFLSPRVNERFESDVLSYDETGEALKLDCESGQIDFIVRPSLLGDDVEKSPECVFLLESCHEVIAKKLFYRGTLLTSRDLFDWMSVDVQAHGLPEKICAARLFDSHRLAALTSRLLQMRDDEKAHQQWAAIRPTPMCSLDEAIDWAMVATPALTRPPERHGGHGLDQPTFG